VPFFRFVSLNRFEGGQVGQRLLLTWLPPDAHKLSLHVCTLSSGDRIEHVALLMHQTALTRGGGKQVRDPAAIMLIYLCPPQHSLTVLTPLCFLPSLPPGRPGSWSHQSDLHDAHGMDPFQVRGLVSQLVVT